jgi:hypothetical protein
LYIHITIDGFCARTGVMGGSIDTALWRPTVNLNDTHLLRMPRTRADRAATTPAGVIWSAALLTRTSSLPSSQSARSTSDRQDKAYQLSIRNPGRSSAQSSMVTSSPVTAAQTMTMSSSEMRSTAMRAMMPTLLASNPSCRRKYHR